jgi:hypothetical protein
VLVRRRPERMPAPLAFLITALFDVLLALVEKSHHIIIIIFFFIIRYNNSWFFWTLNWSVQKLYVSSVQ